MFIGYTGTPGAGKTYEAVRKIIDNLRMGRVVFTNIDGMNAPECLEMIKCVTGLNDCGLADHLFFFEDWQLEEFWNHVIPGSLIVLDEVQNIFSSREWQSQKNISFNAWASTHRHHGYDVVLITQSIMRIDTAVRALVEWTYCFRKVNFFGSLFTKKYLRYAYGGEDTSGAPLSKTFRTYHSFIFLCYKSYVSGDAKELGIMKHSNVLKHPVFYAIPCVFAFFIYMLFNSGMLKGDFFGTKDLVAKSQQIQKFKPTPRSSAPPGAPSVRTPYSKHTPNIYQGISSSGQTLFSNRLKNEPSTDKDNEK
jgi:zona occludens toxin